MTRLKAKTPMSGRSKTPRSVRKLKPTYADMLKKNMRTKYMKLAKSAKKVPSRTKRPAKTSATPVFSTVGFPTVVFCRNFENFYQDLFELCAVKCDLTKLAWSY